jgi:ribosomal-protein-alanine N-acetyltransferase
MIKEYNSYPQISVDNFIYKMKKEEFIQDPFLKLLTYEEENIVKGILLYSEIYDRIEINQIEVIPIYQNRHIASSLMQYLIDQAKNKKIINITLEVKCDNYKAINLYQKYNFEKQAVRKKYYNGIDGILMELKIN